MNAVLRGAASFSKLETFDASGVSPFAMDALASALTGGFDGLRVLRLARCQAVHKSNCRGASHWLIAHRCQLRDGSIVELCRALRSRDAPPLEVLDVSNNGLGDGDPSGEDDALWFRAPFFGPLGALVGDASTLDDADKEKDLVEGERRDGPLSLTSLDASGNRLRPENVRGVALGLSVSRLRHLSINDNPDVGNCIALGAAIRTVRAGVLSFNVRASRRRCRLDGVEVDTWRERGGPPYKRETHAGGAARGTVPRKNWTKCDGRRRRGGRRATFKVCAPPGRLRE